MSRGGVEEPAEDPHEPFEGAGPATMERMLRVPLDGERQDDVLGILS